MGCPEYQVLRLAGCGAVAIAIGFIAKIRPAFDYANGNITLGGVISVRA